MAFRPPPAEMDQKDIIRHIKMQAYRRGKVLGKGTEGTVFEIVFPNNFTIAMKEVSLRGMTQSRARQVTQLYKKVFTLSHPNIVQTHLLTFSKEDAALNLWMENLSGGSLRSWGMRAFGDGGGEPSSEAGSFVAAEEPSLNKAAQVSVGSFRQIDSGVGFLAADEKKLAMYVKQVLEGLDYLHHSGVVHRDIKGGNILLSSDRSVAKIVDFGSVKLVTGDVNLPSTPTHSGTLGVSPSLGGSQVVFGHGHPQDQTHDMDVEGTAFWLAPEVLTQSAPSSAASDIWSLGITVAEVLNGGRPPYPQFDHVWSAMLHMAATGMKPEMPTEASPECQHFISRCWVVAPAMRASSSELFATTWIRGSGPLNSSSDLQRTASLLTPTNVRSTTIRRKGSGPGPRSLLPDTGLIEIAPPPEEGTPVASPRGDGSLTPIGELSMVDIGAIVDAAFDEGLLHSSGSTATTTDRRLAF